jgi:hypothetical protein
MAVLLGVLADILFPPCGFFVFLELDYYSATYRKIKPYVFDTINGNP